MSNSPKRRGFTLVELVVVMGIIVILLSILLPALAKVRAHAQATLCKSNLRNLMQGFLAFANDHDGSLPGAYYDDGDPVAAHHDWLESTPGDPTTAPQGGTLFKYINNKAVYLCPGTTVRIDLANSAASSQWGEWASNGYFDYAAFGVWAGARITTIQLKSRFWKSDGTYDNLPTPIICEEDAATLNGSDPEGDHSNHDQISHRHNSGGHYASIDGSVVFYIEPAVGNGGAYGANCWYSIAPSGTSISLGSTGFKWGQWSTQ